jgi:hypothetical protein
MSFARTGLPTPQIPNANARDAYELALDYNNKAGDAESRRNINQLRSGQDIFGASYERRVAADAPIRNAATAQSMIGAGSNVQSSALSSEGSRLSGEASLLDALGRADPMAARLRARQSSGQYGVADTTPGSAINREGVAQPVPFKERLAGGGDGGDSSAKQSNAGGRPAGNPFGNMIQQSREMQAIQDNSENFRAASKQNRDIDMMNRQASLDAQVRAQEGQRASESGKSQRESAERIAAMNAQSQALGGLFGSIGQRQQSNFWS